MFFGRNDAKAETPVLDHLMWRVDSLEKTLMLGGIGGRRRRGRQRMRWLDGITDSMDMSLSELGVGDGQGSLACCDSWGSKESHTTEWLIWSDHILLDFICLSIVEGFSVYIHKTHWFVVSFILFDIFIWFCYHVILVSGVPSSSFFGQLCEKLVLIFFFQCLV